MRAMTDDNLREQLARRIDPDAFDDDHKPPGWVARQKMAQNAAERVLRPIAEAVDLCWKATPYGTTEDGDIATYLVPKGVVHRLVGALQGAGVSAALRNAPKDRC